MKIELKTIKKLENNMREKSISLNETVSFLRYLN